MDKGNGSIVRVESFFFQKNCLGFMSLVALLSFATQRLKDVERDNMLKNLDYRMIHTSSLIKTILNGNICGFMGLLVCKEYFLIAELFHGTNVSQRFKSAVK